MGRAEILLCVILQPELLEHLNIVLNSLYMHKEVLMLDILRKSTLYRFVVLTQHV